MDPNDESNGSSFCRDEKVKAMELLEESWFFENLFITRRPRIPRCNSDPCYSSGLVSEPVLLKGKESDEAANNSSASEVTEGKKFQKANSFGGSRLLHQSSDPLVLEAAIKAHSREMKEVNKSEGNGKRSKLLRTPSLPPSVGREEKFQVCDPRPGKQTSKSYSIPRSRPGRSTEGESSFSTEGIKEMRRRYLKQRTMRKSLSDLEFEEVQGFKDLGFSFEKETISPSVASIIPGLQEKNREETEKDKSVRRPYLSEAWLVQSCVPPHPPPPIPTCTSNKSSKDMKQHIKFWARAVASNVRQEC
ncbi:uncharacterized protein LOC129316476 [Prosopis cineraria]|uniref:uncharacterized protein LOC129316476 n=1 Tax=Prosopis cineraria TaxID=364024 RepID=UPI00240FAA05|nr:uncharacterized protein LOC129316476 [Prosopis cineraria]